MFSSLPYSKRPFSARTILGAVTRNITLTQAQANNTLAATLTNTDHLALTKTQADNTLVAVATNTDHIALARSQADNTLVATATSLDHLLLTKTQADNTIAATLAAGAVPVVITPAAGFDAGGFGKWFNLAYGTTSSSSRRPAVRHTEVGRLLDELVYGEEDRARLEELDAEDREEAAEIVREATETVRVRGDTVETGRLARALVAEQERAFQALLNVQAEEARRLFMTGLAMEARRRWESDVAARIAQDDADLLILAELVL